MNKLLIKISLLLLLIVIIFLTVLSIIYTPTYVYRLLAYNVGDVYDHKHFEKRSIKAADTPYIYPQKIDESYVESLFGDQLYKSSCKTFDEWIKKSETTAIIFIRKDTIIYENYFNGFNRDSYFHSMSVAKSFISTLIGFAVQDGLISSVNDPITKYIPELKKRDHRFSNITIRNLLMMQSGLKYFEGYFPGTNIHLPWHDEAVAYYHPEMRKHLIENVKISSDAGKRFQYNNYCTAYLGLILEKVTNKTVSTYLEEKLWREIGTEFDAQFAIDSKESGFELMPSIFVARAIDYAKFGRLFLHNGNWNGKQIVSEKWVKEATTEDKTISREYYPSYMGSGENRNYYKYQWWGTANADSTYNFMALGNLGQTIYIIPDQETIILHFGNSNKLYEAKNDLWQVSSYIKHHEFHRLIYQKGIAEGVKEFRLKQKENPKKYTINEKTLNNKGYAYLNIGKIEEAIHIFSLNVELYPNSSNVYDSLGEAYMIKNERKKAIVNYEKSLELNPNNSNAREMISRLSKGLP